LGEVAEVAGVKGKRSCVEGNGGCASKPVAVCGFAVIEKERAAVCDFDVTRVPESSVGFEDELCTAYEDFADESGGVVVEDGGS